MSHEDRSPSSPSLGEVLGPVPGWVFAALGGSWAGELLVARGGGRSTAVVAGAVALVALLAAAALRTRRRRPPALTLGVLAAAAVAAVSVAGVLVRASMAAMGMLPVVAAQGGLVEVVATVVAEPRQVAGGWQVLVGVEEVEGTETRERATFTRPGDPPALGSRWRMHTTARPLPEGGYGRWLARQHAVVVLDPVSLVPVGDPGPLAGASEWVREAARRAATRHLDPAIGGLLVGFVTGDTRLLPESAVTSMRATGLTHLTAVSGSNLAIVVAGVLGLCALLRVSATGRRLALVVVVPWFAFVTRFEPSVLRAGVMAGVLMLAGVLGHRHDARHALAVTVLLLVLVDPLLASSAGLLLSAAATAGVLLAAPVIRRRLPARLPSRWADLAAITFGAQLAVVPLLLVFFGELRLAALPANLLAVPAAMFAAVGAFAATLVAVFHLEAGAALFVLASPGAGLVLAVAERFADVGGVVELTRPAGVAVVLAGGTWMLLRAGTGASRMAAATTLVALVAVAAPVLGGSLPPEGLRVTAIDVGQGDAFLVEGAGVRILVDAGPDESAVRWLRAHGRHHLDLVVVTHADLDHVGGVPDVLRRLRVGALWIAPPSEPSVRVSGLLALADRRGVVVRHPQAPEVFALGDLVIEVLNPPHGRAYRHSPRESNDASFVLRIGHGPRRVLLTGDVERAAQARLLTDHPEAIRAEVLTVPHHGAGGTDPDFLRAVGAGVAIISAGRDNSYGHPHHGVLEALAGLGVRVHRTDRDGTVSLTVPDRAPVPSGGVGHD